MIRYGSRFKASYPASCEGEGDVIVSYPDGASVLCRIGYVAVGMGQDLRFAVHGRSCKDLNQPQHG